MKTFSTICICIKKTINLNSPFVKNLFTYASGIAVAQGISMASALFLTRLYTPENFGTLGLYISITSIFFTVVNLRYHVPITIPKSEKVAINIFGLSIVTSCFISSLILTAIIIIKQIFPKIFILNNLFNFLYLIPISVIINGFYQPLRAWFVRHKSYKVVSASQILQSITTVTIQISSGVLSFGTIGLLLGRVTGELVGLITLSLQFLNTDFKKLVDINILKMKALSKKQFHFPLYETPLMLIKRFGTELPLILLTAVFNMTTVGFYVLAIRMVATPFNFIEMSMNQVFYQELCDRHKKNEDLHLFIKKTFINLVKITCLPYLLIVIIAPIAFKVFFGPIWITSGHITQLLAPFLYTEFLCSPLTTISQLFNKQKILIFFEIIRIALISSSILISNKSFHSPTITIAFLSTCLTILNISILFYLINITKKEKHNAT